MTDDTRITRLKLLWKAIDDEEAHFALQKTSHKDRMESLQSELRKLRYEIETGQKELQLTTDPTPGEIPLQVSDGKEAGKELEQ